MKQIVKVSLILGATLLMGAGCTFFKKGTNGLPPYDFPPALSNISSTSTTEEAPKVQQDSGRTELSKNCGENEACANAFIKNCTKGSFIYGFADVKAEVLYTVKGMNNNSCDVEWGFVEVDYPLTGLKMTCPVASGVEGVKQFDKSNFDNRYINCVGPLKDTLTKPMNEIPPKPIPAENQCKDADCINRLLGSCAEGIFTLTRNNAVNKTTTVLDFRIKYRPNSKVCLAEVKITQSQNSKLIGPTMECALREKIKTAFDVQNFISSKFQPLEENSYSTCIGDLYELVKDLGEMEI